MFPRSLFSLLIAFASVLWAQAASAHSTPGSVIYVDQGASEMDIEIHVPAAELAYAVGGNSNFADEAGLARNSQRLESFFADRLSVRGVEGADWIESDGALSLDLEAARPDIVYRTSLTPPAGAEQRVFSIAYDGVIDTVRNHVVMIFLRSDYRGGKLGTNERLLGALQGDRTQIDVDLGPGSTWRGFVGAIGVGMEHIAIGHDHILFLIALILPAPLLFGGGQWGGYGGARYTLRRLLGIVTAFTIGHSITLLAGAFLNFTLPAPPVEILIALSILISAIHAWRPIFAGKEAWVAAGFGLVHGLAFATIIAEYGVETLRRAEAILGFNLGIEIVQLLIIAAVFPALLLFARTRFYPAVRIAGAAFAGIAAFAWMLERMFGTPNPVAFIVDAVFAQWMWIVVVLTLAAIAATVFAKDRRAEAAV